MIKYGLKMLRLIIVLSVLISGKVYALPPSQLHSAELLLSTLLGQVTQNSQNTNDVLAAVESSFSEARFQQFLARLPRKDLERLKANLLKAEGAEEVHPYSSNSLVNGRFLSTLAIVWTLHITFQGFYSLEAGNSDAQLNWLTISKSTDRLVGLYLFLAAFKDMQVFIKERGPHRQYSRSRRNVGRLVSTLKTQVDAALDSQIESETAQNDIHRSEIGLFDELTEFSDKKGEELMSELKAIHEKRIAFSEKSTPRAFKLFSHFMINYEENIAKEKVRENLKLLKQNSTVWEENEIRSKLEAELPDYFDDLNATQRKKIAKSERQLVEELAIWLHEDPARSAQNILDGMAESERELREFGKKSNAMPKHMLLYMTIFAFVFNNAGAYTNMGKDFSPLDWVIPFLNFNVDNTFIREFWIQHGGWQMGGYIGLVCVLKVIFENLYNQFRFETGRTDAPPNMSLVNTRYFWNEMRRLLGMADKLATDLKANANLRETLTAKHTSIALDPVVNVYAHGARVSRCKKLLSYYQQALKARR